MKSNLHIKYKGYNFNILFFGLASVERYGKRQFGSKYAIIYAVKCTQALMIIST